MSRPFTTRGRLLSLMSDRKPRSTGEVTERLGVTARAAESACCLQVWVKVREVFLLI
jgi:hypothetical protein